MFEQSSLFGSLSYSVLEITRYIRNLLERDELLNNLWVRGEVSNLSRPRSGHIYFTLKDADASLGCVMWRSNAARLMVNLQEGMAVEAYGSIGVYERDGRYQLYVDTIRPAGEGMLYQAFMRLKAQLEAEGLFDEDRKRLVPERPNIIGVVTSPTAAALQDVLNTLRQRYPLARVVLSPTSVQGDAAPREMIAAIERLNVEISPDVILLVRGGGSLEDLWAFNDEGVVRAVVASQAPVITGVGHETDFTLVDFASDLRAPTPTGAAVLATPELIEILTELRDLQARLSWAVEHWLNNADRKVSELSMQLAYLSPQNMIQNDRQRLDGLQERLLRSLRSYFSLRKATVASIARQLDSLSPSAVLARGFVLVNRKDGLVLRSINQIKIGEEVRVSMLDGTFDAEVQQVFPHDKED